MTNTIDPRKAQFVTIADAVDYYAAKGATKDQRLGVKQWVEKHVKSGAITIVEAN